MLDIVQEYLARTGKTMVVVHGWDINEDDIRAIKNLFEGESEEKKMLNFDKYRDVFIDKLEMCRAINYSGGTVACAAQFTKEHADELARHFSPPASDEAVLEWLFGGYEPPVLINGDGLKPGDWIMVRNSEGEEWRKRRFMCFCRGKFITSDNSIIALFGHGSHSDWEQARLPEDGE